MPISYNDLIAEGNSLIAISNKGSDVKYYQLSMAFYSAAIHILDLELDSVNEEEKKQLLSLQSNIRDFQSSHAYHPIDKNVLKVQNICLLLTRMDSR